MNPSRYTRVSEEAHVLLRRLIMERVDAQKALLMDTARAGDGNGRGQSPWACASTACT